MAEHNTLTDPELHEPKGISTAAAGQVYVSDGGGSGNWAYNADYAQLYVTDSDSHTIGTIGTTPQKMAFTQSGPSAVSSANATTNEITIAQTGVYEVMFNCGCSTVAFADSGIYEWHLAVNGTESDFGIFSSLSGTSDQGSVGFSCLISLTAGDVLSILLESDSVGDTDDLNITYAQFSAQKL